MEAERMERARAQKEIETEQKVENICGKSEETEHIILFNLL